MSLHKGDVEKEREKKAQKGSPGKKEKTAGGG